MNEATLTTFTWLIPLFPLASFFLIFLVTRHNRTLTWMLSWAAIITSLVMGWIVAFNTFGLSELLSGGQKGWKEHVHHLVDHPVVIESSVAWLPFRPEIGSWLRMGVAVDPLTAVMLFMVPFAITMIFIYSVGYHNYGKPRGTKPGVPNHGKEEPMFTRFFGFFCLFAAAMLTLVVADNLLLLFVGWEVMGLCSYLLIGFWYGREYDDPKATPPRKASIKAFMTTRVADVVMLMGIVYFYRAFGTLNFSEAFTAEALAAVGAVTAGVIALLLFAGTVGKSAQWPLHTWLPDAMEGPTPVSAMIHAAAMVSAGVYMVVRIFPLLALGLAGSESVGLIVGGIGAITALMAATIAVAQNDVKRVLAYSTISQLGFMIAALGIGAYVAAAFHLITHAFFKALLFLGSGSIIHGMEHGAEHVHDHHTDPQDMMNMGGLKDKMPRTFITFVIGGLALAGFPFVTAGFWSKDEILADAWHQGTHGNTLGMIIFIMLCIAAFLTAFYTMRQIALTFLGQPRTPLAEHAHESNNYMTLPLLALAVFAIGFGWLGIPDTFLGTEGVFYNYYHHFVGATVEHTLHELHALVPGVHELVTLEFDPVPLIASIVVALGGLTVGYLVYGRNPLKANEPDPLIAPLGPLYTFLKNKWYWDELYDTIFVQPTIWFSETFVYEWVDKGVIDGTLHLAARSTYAMGQYVKRFEERVINDGVDAIKDAVLWLSKEFRSIQAGNIQEYALMSVLTAAAFTILLILLPRIIG
ncbi:MAG: NADH-quinone oxidoreductase subunit L [Anaerolineae bacterium]|nr:NADH-quinone oxidoreductase subunit L [Anaerolineae bacterium]